MYEKELNQQKYLELASYVSLIFAVPIAFLVFWLYRKSLDELGSFWENILLWIAPSIFMIGMVYWASYFKCPRCKNNFLKNKSTLKQSIVSRVD